MEIYSPRSKNKDLFQKNQLKKKQVIEDNSQTTVDNKPFFTPVEVVSNKENFVVRAGKIVSEKLKVFFELNETV